MLQQTAIETKSISNLKLGQYFISQLKDMYWAEQHLVKTLPKMQKAATSDNLMQALDYYQTQSQLHVSRLEYIFDLLDIDRSAEKCLAMAGMTTEASEINYQTEDYTLTRDAALILVAQKAQHYKIATYGGMKQLAHSLDHMDISGILEQTLKEEKEADALLTQIAIVTVNPGACLELAG